ncbi:hypothetical protein NSK_005889 [Nannochloropsis salina CCMP1776]|nr:translocase of inner mitochondrial membrane 13 [Nannochloropsis gaditana]TFJ82814.1 hypothetical protein NSK_005889 [Nannochloropsis salina CCMP1776]|eukprot:TFJ82814.1 hypothetical protein NSK_005889 [Nannochloropsis salina CCMP1776]
MAQKLTPDQQEAVIHKFRAEMAAQAMQELVQKMTDKCFSKCTGKSGNRLDSKEQNCVAMCMDRYIETMNVVQHSLSERSATR